MEYLSPPGFELQNMIILARLMVRAAMLREESRGCHYRVDFPGMAEFWRCHVVFSSRGGRVTRELREVGRLTGDGYAWEEG